MIAAVIWMINLVPFCCQLETRESDLALKELALFNNSVSLIARY